MSGTRQHSDSCQRRIACYKPNWDTNNTRNQSMMMLETHEVAMHSPISPFMNENQYTYVEAMHVQRNGGI